MEFLTQCKIEDETDPIKAINRIGKRLMKQDRERRLDALSLLLILRRVVMGGDFTEEERLFFKIKRTLDIEQREFMYE